MLTTRGRIRCALVAVLIVPLVGVAAPTVAAPTTSTPQPPSSSSQHFGKFKQVKPSTSSPRARSLLAATGCANTRFQTCDTTYVDYDQYETRVVNGASQTVYLGTYRAQVDTQVRLGRTQGLASAIVNVGPITVISGKPVPGDKINLEATHNGKHAGIVQFIMSPTTGQLDDGFGYQYNPDITTDPASHEDFLYLASTVGAPPTEPGVFRTNITVRCDNTAYNTASVGCVNPVPAITVSMSQYPQISENIAYQVSQGAPTVLHREKSDTARLANREVFRPSSRSAPLDVRLDFARKYNDQPSCDEYPFASSKEGGGSTPGGWRWVPLKQGNNKQGGTISAFYTNNRVMDNEPYTVSY